MSPTTTPTLRAALPRLLLVLALLPLSPAFAANIVGSAINAQTGAYLAGVAISVSGQTATAVSDRDGGFRLTGIAPGTYALEASYLGQETIRRTVSVPASGDARVDFEFAGEVQKLASFVVEGYRDGWAKALQQKKTANNIAEIISADSVGNLPDRNVADAIARLPGIALIADSGEGQFVTIRGLNPNLNNITLNGATLASPGIRSLDGRDSVSGSVVPLDVIGSANIAQIEVTKTLTPDMDASAIGGTINLRTASAFDRKDRFLYGSLTGGYGDLAEKEIFEGDVTFGDRFGKDRKVGVALTANYSHRPFRTEAFQSVWQNAAFGDQRFVPLAIELLPEDAVRDRIGVTANVEYRPASGTEYYFNGVYNRFDEENIRQEAITRSNNAMGSFGGPQTVVFNNTRAEHRVFRTDTVQTQRNATAGAKQTWGDFVLNGEATFSNGEQTRPHMRSIQFRNNNISAAPGFTLNYAGFIPVISRGTSTFADATRFSPLRTYDERSVEVEEDITTGRLDLTWSPQRFAERKITLKAGGKYYRNERSVAVDAKIYSGSFNMADTGAVVPGQNVMGYSTEIDLDYDKALAFVESRRNSLVLDQGASLSTSAANTFNVGQDIYAGYAMASAQLGKLSVLGGVRVEATSASIRALEYRSVGTAVGSILSNNADFEYTNTLPNLQARFEIRENLLLRAAVTSAIRRLEYEFAAPSSRLQLNAFSGGGAANIVDPVNFPNVGALTIGNPNLKPYEAMNYDLALEYYLKSGGILSAAVFHKTIENPIYQTIDLRQNFVFNQIGFQDLQISSYQNGKDGKVNGLELALQVPLKFLPAPFDGFGIDGNITLVSSSVEVFSRPGVKLRLFEQPDRTVSGALYYQKGRVSARVAYTYQTESLRQIGTDALRDFWRADHYQTDAQASFRLSEKFTLFANVQNITDQPQDTYQGLPERLRFRRMFGWNARFGVRFRL